MLGSPSFPTKGVNKINPSQTAAATRVPTHTFSNYKLPIEFHPSKYENVVKFNNYLYMVPLKDYYFIKIKFINKDLTKSKLFFKDQIVLEYSDRKIDDNSFVRFIGKNKYNFISGKLELMETIKKTKFISKLIKPKKNIFNILTLDIETYLDNNNFHVPYCICIYDGNTSYKFYLDEFNNPEEMLIKAIKFLCNWKYNNFNIYAHNFSSFDGIFLLKFLNKIGHINPIIKDGKLISVNLIFSGTKEDNKIYTINFFDSILLLPNSLRKLGNSFNVANKKQKLNFDPTIFNENNYIDFKNIVMDYGLLCNGLYLFIWNIN
nr:hypothetical protein [Lentinula edodes]UZS77797.1 hypothetical protein [Lentinula edodes]UZS77847.1 hypothetical protein [Lentinula edodes]UZS77897.1 hypothetical protein [Lentinula edodes]UZS77947.1 hypothetical protein [Lentinula edodes]